MKRTLAAACLALGGFAWAAPLPCSLPAWDLDDPLAWKADAAARTICGRGSPDAAVFRAPRSARVRISARVTPERVTGTNGWSTIGVALVDDDRNLWHAALVAAPADWTGGRAFFELAEMRDGRWLAEQADRLVCTRRRQTAAWRFGETYEVTLESTPAGVSGSARNARGEVVWEAGYAYPKPEAGGEARAVTCGRPALRTTGSFCGTFAAPDADWSEARPRPAPPAAVFPPYASDSFVPGVTDRATGFFRVVEKDGRWWVIDPLGRGTILFGVDHVTYWGHHSQRTGRSLHHEANKARFPNKADWEADTIRRLKAWGFNMLGAGCDAQLQHRGLVHTVFLSIGDALCRKGRDPDVFICPNEDRPCSAFPNVFHPAFAAWADSRARKLCAPRRRDPWLFGYFIDNELAWWGRGKADTGLFDAVAQLPASHPARAAQRRFLAERGVAGEATPAVKLDFLRLAAETYFRVAAEAIRRHDPNHLVMGARFAGLDGAHPAVWEIAGRHCDVVTFNCYPWADLDRNVVRTDRRAAAPRVAEAFAARYALVKRPMLVTEWSFPALDSGLPCTGGAGQRFRTQALRTQATSLFARTMLALPFFVGYDYFMWVDEPAAGISDAFPEDSNYGLIDERGRAYPEITDMFARLHRNVAAVRAAGLPPERAVAAAPETTARAARARLGAARPATFARDGDRYVVRNAAGLELEGRVGGRRMFDAVRLNGRNLGEYTGMWSERVDGTTRWHDAGRVVAVAWRVEDDGRGVLDVTCEGGDAAQGRKLAMTHAITVSAERPWFLCDLVAARNAGSRPIEVSAFFFREYAPYAGNVSKGQRWRVPNLWKDVAGDAWFASADGAFFGGVTEAPTVEQFSYFLTDGGKSQHPDAMFRADEAGGRTLPPGACYAPQGRIWMYAVCGLDGVAGWKRIVGEVEAGR